MHLETNCFRLLYKYLRFLGVSIVFLSQDQFQNLLDMLQSEGVLEVAASLSEMGINVEIGEIENVLRDLEQVISDLASGSYGPASTEELKGQSIRLLREAFAQGREIIVEPSVSIPVGDEFVLNGTIITRLLTNEGAIADEGGIFGDNLFTGFFQNLGDVDFSDGKDFIVSSGGGIQNLGNINTDR